MSTGRQSGLQPPFDAVAVIGSQGALRSFEFLLGRLPASFPAAIIFDLHRTDAYGVTERRLGRCTGLAVRAVSDGDALDAACVHVAPADRQLTIAGERRMWISEAAPGHGHRSADGLLMSAALAIGPRLIAVVLSGRLEGGARGVREVKRQGGRVLVEDPSGAAAPSMPNAALATGCVDFALSPERIGDALVAMCAAVGGAELFRVRMNAGVAVAR